MCHNTQFLRPTRAGCDEFRVVLVYGNHLHTTVEHMFFKELEGGQGF
jgi:hypothetical protein